MAVHHSTHSEISSLDEISLKLNEWWKYLRAKQLKIILGALIAGIIGIVYAWLTPATYTAKLTFVVEETKTGGGGLGSLASLAGQFGVDLGGSGGGMLSGDNVLVYFKSESLAKETLITPLSENSKISLADRYAEIYDHKQKWLENDQINQLVNFPPVTVGVKYTTLQDSLLNVLVYEINSKRFSIGKTDKRANFIDAHVTTKDAIFSKRYCELIVDKAINKYQVTKTKRQKSTVDKLQFRADSILNLLNRKTSMSASLQTTSTTKDINPIYKTNTAIAVETVSRDKTVLVTMFAEIVKNLELAKFTLSQETPVIQIIDSPELPLTRNRYSKALLGISFSLFFMLISILFYTVKKQLE